MQVKLKMIEMDTELLTWAVCEQYCMNLICLRAVQNV